MPQSTAGTPAEKETVMCTAVRFTDENGGLFFGRNLDWTESYGEKILATPRGFAYDYALGATQSK